MKITKQNGVSLLEVLISVLVLSVGLLGLGGLQLYALKGSNDSHFRTAASLLAADLGDRIRLNGDGVDLGSYTFSETQSTTICDNQGIKICTGSTTCSASELANFDLYQISCGVKNGSNTSLGMRNLLPNATLSINCGAVSCDRSVEHIITFKWRETDNHDTNNNQVKTLVWNVLP